MISTDQLQDLLDGGTVVTEDGDKIGKVGQVFLDDQTGEPEWVTASTGMFGGAETFIPLAQGNASGNEIRVPYSRDTVKDAPCIESSEGHLSQDQEAELYRYYGMAYSESDSESGLPQGEADGHETGRVEAGSDDAMTRSEEQLRVGTEKVQTGRARLRKYVVTEDVTTTVPVTREEMRLEREPIAEGDPGTVGGGAEIGEDEHEVVLTEERVVVSKETVPVERVRMGTETVTEDQQVSESVRKEQIETDTSDARPDDSRR